MILFIGDVARGDRDREGFQEVDFPAFFAPIAKWAARIEDARRIPEYVARAYRVATVGRPGPVVLALPEDMLRDEADVPDRPRVPIRRARSRVSGGGESSRAPEATGSRSAVSRKRPSVTLCMEPSTKRNGGRPMDRDVYSATRDFVPARVGLALAGRTGADVIQRACSRDRFGASDT